MLLIWFIIGIFIGSFLNVCIYRLPLEKSVVHPRSYCVSCNRTIVWYDNIPLLSYLLLRAKCRYCHAKIHWRYPVVEFLGGVACVVMLKYFGVNAKSFVYLVFVWSLIVVSFIDLEHRIIPDEISLGGLVLGLILSLIIPSLHGTDRMLVSLGRSFIGVLVGGGVLYVTGAFGSWIFKKEAMGGGDIKLLAMAGSILGWKIVTLTFFLAPMIAIVPGIFVLLFKKSHEIPYGPFLAVALIVSLFYGEQILISSGIQESFETLWSYYGWGA